MTNKEAIEELRTVKLRLETKRRDREFYYPERMRRIEAIKVAISTLEKLSTGSGLSYQQEEDCEP